MNIRWNPVVRIAVLVTFWTAAACRRSPEISRVAAEAEHGEPRGVEPRGVEPRLTGFPMWQPCTAVLTPGEIIEDADCGASHISKAPVSVGVEACDEMIRNHQEALRALVSIPPCTVTAIEQLEELESRGPTGPLLSDLSGAYYLRAQRDDQPVALLSSLDAADRALRRNPASPEARFNRALTLTALGFSTEAMAAWDELRHGPPSPWTAEAGDRWNRLASETSIRAATQWPLNKRRLQIVVRAGDVAAVAKLIEPFGTAARRYVEEEVLPAWAEASLGGDINEALEQLALARAIAKELLRASGDPYLLEVVEAIDSASSSPIPMRFNALRRGHLALRDARLADRALEPQKASVLYGQARQGLETGGSPLRHGAELGRAVALSFRKDLTETMGMLEPLEHEARRHRYQHLLGRVQSNQAYFLLYQNRLLESLARYDDALATFQAIGDEENIANVHSRKIGIFRTLGNDDRAWREAFLALRHGSGVVEAQFRHFLLGEIAASALSLGYPRIALLYQDAAVRLVQEELGRTPPEDTKQTAGLRSNLGIALRARAAIKLHLEDYNSANEDLARAVGFTPARPDEDDEGIRRALLARIKDVEGEALVGIDPKRAIASFTEALRLAEATRFRSFNAGLLTKRAGAYRRAGNRPEAERDLRKAIDELRQEEIGLLVQRTRGRGEELWTAYFSRSLETYHRLIRMLVDDGRTREAFDVAEKARAFEPMNLVLQREGLAPEAFRKWTRQGEAWSVKRIQAALPAKTYLIEYSVLEDRTYAWIVSHEAFQTVTLKVRNDEIQQWSNRVRRAAEDKDPVDLEMTLHEAYAGLIKDVIGYVATPEAGTSARLVFSPDGPMHGLPVGALRADTKSRYLLEDHRVSVAASGTFYLFSLLRDQQLSAGGRPRVLLIGDPAFAPSDLTRGLQRLRGGRSEVNRIAALYGPAGNVLVDKDATVARFLELARGATVVHLAAHVIANPQAPFRSMMLFARSADHSGLFDAEELLTRLEADHARLFVLSACSSAGGVAIGPEGLAPLVRPIITAGVPAVVGSLWNVGDAASAELLVEFHRHYHDGEDADEALRLAQIALLKGDSAGLRSILAWAPFQVIGHASSPFPPLDRKTGDMRWTSSSGSFSAE
jgi:CHAT domain-containing protein/tetratricopeptide (TPR) repeat protein